jgi:hypothetical protein
MDLPPDPFALRRTRQLLHDVAADALGPNRLFSLQLCACEVLSNAVRLGFSLDEPVDVEAERDRDAVRVTIAQHGHGGAEPASHCPGSDCLPMADELADRWALEPEPPIRLWFEMDLHPSGSSLGAPSSAKRRLDTVPAIARRTEGRATVPNVGLAGLEPATGGS